MKTIAFKTLVILLCVPVYPLAMFGEWYEKSGRYGGRFSLRESSKEYWEDVGRTLKYRKEARR